MLGGFATNDLFNLTPTLPGITNPIGPINKNMTNSISALTGGKYTTLKATDPNDIPSGAFVQVIETVLAKCGYPVNRPTGTDEGCFDAYTMSAVKQFQIDTFGSVLYGTGELNDSTWQKMNEIANQQAPDVIEEEPDETSTETTEQDASDSPHYQPFFHKDNEKQFRQNHKDIRIIFGTSGIVKTIHDVVMRSVGVEIDTSGNPISETYEFIARDVTEDDEPKDTGKYKNENGVSPSDIQYKFNFYDFDK